MTQGIFNLKGFFLLMHLYVLWLQCVAITIMTFTQSRYQIRKTYHACALNVALNICATLFVGQTIRTICILYDITVRIHVTSAKYWIDWAPETILICPTCFNALIDMLHLKGSNIQTIDTLSRNVALKCQCCFNQGHQNYWKLNSICHYFNH